MADHNGKQIPGDNEKEYREENGDGNKRPIEPVAPSVSAPGGHGSEGPLFISFGAPFYRAWMERNRKREDVSEPIADEDAGGPTADEEEPYADPELLSSLETAAECGDGAAMLNLGILYWNGQDGVEQDFEKSVYWLKLAIKEEQASACWILGDLYSNGWSGFPLDEERAREYYQLGANSGDGICMHRLGVFYEEGMGGLEQDAKEAVRWYQESAEADCAQAMYRLGWAYEDGCGVPRDEEMAAHWYAQGARLDDGACLCELGMLYYDGRGGLKKDVQEAERLLGLAADQGVSRAKAFLGARLLRETDTDGQNLDRAIPLLADAAQQGDRTAMYNLAIVLLTEPLKEDIPLGLHWLNKAAEKGLAIAANALARGYDFGCYGLEEDVEAAHKWYRRAAEGGDTEATQSLINLWEQGLYGKGQNDKALVEWLENASDKGNPIAMFELAHFYETGTYGLPKDLERSKRMRERAAELSQIGD